MQLVLHLHEARQTIGRNGAREDASFDNMLDFEKFAERGDGGLWSHAGRLVLAHAGEIGDTVWAEESAECGEFFGGGGGC